MLTFSPEDHLAGTCIKPFQTAGYGFVSADKCTDILEVVPILVNFIFYRLYEPIPGLHSALGIVTRFDQQNVLPLPDRRSLVQIIRTDKDRKSTRLNSSHVAI